jgi:hypothetical protein
VADLVIELAEAQAEHRLSRLEPQLDHLDLLILDELRLVKVSADQAQLLFIPLAQPLHARRPGGHVEHGLRRAGPLSSATTAAERLRCRDSFRSGNDAADVAGGVDACCSHLGRQVGL